MVYTMSFRGQPMDNPCFILSNQSVTGDIEGLIDHRAEVHATAGPPLKVIPLPRPFIIINYSYYQQCESAAKHGI